jgi:hypothetical protein
MNLYGEILESTRLRFSYSSTYATHANPRQGLRRFGPYDSGRFAKDSIQAGIVYPKNLESTKGVLVEQLTRTNYGFQRLFGIPLHFTEERPIGDGDKLSNVFQNILRHSLDMIFIIVLKQDEEIYRKCKSILLGNGIPSQVILSDKLQDERQSRWVLENVALASYAKVGGTPWVVANPAQKNQLVLGLSRVQDHNNRYLVGFVTLFTQDGDFILMHSKAPVIKWSDYVRGLSNLICEAIEEYESLKGCPDSIIVHLHKRPGNMELEAIDDALSTVGNDIAYALLHLNEYSNFRLFDTSHRGYVPPKGLKVNLSSHEALLLLDGRSGSDRRKIGVPRVLDVMMDKRSTLPVDGFSHLVRQVNDFASVNWRGFNAAAIPVTLNYSKLIARMVVEVGADEWSEVIASGKLRDKAWFL